MKKHVASGYEGKKPFKCDICDYRYPVKTKMKTYFASVHEGYKPFKLNTLVNTHVHEKKNAPLKIISLHCEATG